MERDGKRAEGIKLKESEEFKATMKKERNKTLMKSISSSQEIVIFNRQGRGFFLSLRQDKNMGGRKGVEKVTPGWPGW